LECVIRDRELRYSLLKRKRAGKSSRIDRVMFWMAPLGVLQDIVVSFMGPGILYLTTSGDFAAPRALTTTATCLSVILIASLVFMHCVRVTHAFRLLRRGRLIVDDLFGGLIFLALWTLVVGWLALAYFWEFLYWLVWR